MKKNKGFTLVELMGVIIILSLLIILAAPPILEKLKKTEKDIDDASFALIESAVDLFIDDNADAYPNVNGSIYCISLQQLVNSDKLKSPVLNAKTGEEINLSTLVEVRLINNNLDVTINNSCEEYYFSYNYDKGVNKPQLVTGMTPIKWNGTAWEDTTEDDPNWYSYTSTDKKWANARTADGSFWVWIPRYIYRISGGWHSSTTGTVDIQFSIGMDDTIGETVSLVNTGNANDSNGNWTSHPAFTFGSSQLAGIWVAKFEATASEGVANTSTDDNVTTKTIKIVPNVQSWRNINIGNSFTVSRNMETNPVYGWGTTGQRIDTHLMKNTEWGALVYLSKSVYGKNTVEIWKNPADNYTTGCAGDTATATATVGCTYTYETANGINASTTGNIYGVYDVAGGSWEFVAAYVDNGSTSLSNYGSAIINADKRYKNVYARGEGDTSEAHYLLLVNKKGDALYETSSSYSGGNSWFNDYSYNPSTSPWYRRGGYSANNNSNGGVFAFYDTNGNTYSNYGFRPILVVSAKL